MSPLTVVLPFTSKIESVVIDVVLIPIDPPLKIEADKVLVPGL